MEKVNRRMTLRSFFLPEKRCARVGKPRASTGLSRIFGREWPENPGKDIQGRQAPFRLKKELFETWTDQNGYNFFLTKTKGFLIHEPSEEWGTNVRDGQGNACFQKVRIERKKRKSEPEKRFSKERQDSIFPPCFGIVQIKKRPEPVQSAWNCTEI